MLTREILKEIMTRAMASSVGEKLAAQGIGTWLDVAPSFWDQVVDGINEYAEQAFRLENEFDDLPDPWEKQRIEASERLILFRRRNRLNQKECGKILGTSGSTVSRIELARRDVDVCTVQACLIKLDQLKEGRACGVT